jgi:predicted transcriptional regulator YdeE
MCEYPSRCQTLPSFDLAGFTMCVTSGGAMYDAVRGDGRWDELRRLGGDDPTIYGVASHDPACPEGQYRYTMAVRTADLTACRDDLFRIHIPASEWVVFSLSCFVRQYGEFWQASPYQLIKALGREFNRPVGLHIDVYAPSYASDEDPMEFWMPVAPR